MRTNSTASHANPAVASGSPPATVGGPRPGAQGQGPKARGPKARGPKARGPEVRPPRRPVQQPEHEEVLSPMIRVVASDLDGTLLRPDLTISGRTRAAIHRSREAGITFVAVTGRPPRSVRQLAGQLGLEGIAICANGALVYDLERDTVLDQTPLAAELA